MENIKPIFWYQGLFLQPQHFQLADLYHQSLLTPLNKYVHPYFWGISQIEIDEGALENRSLVILGGEFVFPDGTYVVLPANATIEQRSFKEAWSDVGRPLKAYLGLRKMDPLAENVTVLPNLENVSGVTTRFVSTVDPSEAKDLYHEGPPAQIKYLLYLPKIFWESEKDELSEYELIPFAQLEMQGDKIVLSRRFIPPSLKMDASNVLYRIVKDISDKVVARCRQLEEYKNPGEIQSSDFEISYSFFLLALRSLSRYVPTLLHLLETRNVHPWNVYGVLGQIIGELSTFSKKISVTEETKDGTNVIPAYDHSDLWLCFSTVQILIGQLLDEITVGPYSIIRLVYEAPNFVGKIDTNILQGNNTYYLVVRTEADSKFVIDAMRTAAKLSTLDNMTVLVSRALPGIDLKYVQFPPPEMPRRANSICFQIDITSTQWEDVKRTQDIALNWDASPKDLNAEIVVLRRA